MNKLGQEIIEAITTEEYETIIFDYLANYCVNLKDKNIKEIVNLKCKQFLNTLKEKKELKEQVKYLRRSIERKEEIILDLRNENTLHSDEYVSNLEKENQQLKAYNKFLMKKDNTLQSLLQWLYKEKENMKYSSVYINYIMIIINKIKELEMSDK